MNKPFGPDPAECYPEATRGLAQIRVEEVNKAAAITGLAYPISGDHLANWDGHGTERALERRIKRAAAPAIKYVINTILDAREDLQLHFEMIDSDPRMTARIRNGHPATPRKQLLHNGGKP